MGLSKELAKLQEELNKPLIKKRRRKKREESLEEMVVQREIKVLVKINPLVNDRDEIEMGAIKAVNFCATLNSNIYFELRFRRRIWYISCSYAVYENRKKIYHRKLEYAHNLTWYLPQDLNE